MDLEKKIVLILGGSFFSIGLVVLVVFASVEEPGVFLAIPGFFVLSGLIMIIAVCASLIKKQNIISRGVKYTGKIFNYIEDRSVTVNGSFLLNARVRYFDQDHNVREAVLPTKFSDGANVYPIGMTIDFYEYNGKFGFDPKSVRYEMLLGEEQLMDEKPIEPGKVNYVAVTCKNCGGSVKAAVGYATKCPYCGGYINV